MSTFLQTKATDATIEAMRDDYIRCNGVTKCLPAVAQGSECSKALRSDVTETRRKLRQQQRKIERKIEQSSIARSARMANDDVLDNLAALPMTCLVQPEYGRTWRRAMQVIHAARRDGTLIHAGNIRDLLYDQMPCNTKSEQARIDAVADYAKVRLFHL